MTHENIHDVWVFGVQGDSSEAGVQIAGFESWLCDFPAVLLEGTFLGFIYATERIMAVCLLGLQYRLNCIQGALQMGFLYHPHHAHTRPVRQLDLYPWGSWDIHHPSLTKGASRY